MRIKRLKNGDFLFKGIILTHEEIAALNFERMVANEMDYIMEEFGVEDEKEADEIARIAIADINADYGLQYEFGLTEKNCVTKELTLRGLY